MTPEENRKLEMLLQNLDEQEMWLAQDIKQMNDIKRSIRLRESEIAKVRKKIEKLVKK